MSAGQLPRVLMSSHVERRALQPLPPVAKEWAGRWEVQLQRAAHALSGRRDSTSRGAAAAANDSVAGAADAAAAAAANVNAIAAADCAMQELLVCSVVRRCQQHIMH